MNLQENIRRILREDKKTKSTNKEFSKYKDSKFNSLRDYTLQDIVDNWDSLSDHKNENIKTIKHFINNPDKIVDLVYDEKGLEDGYHRLLAAKILKKPRFSYRLVENQQESIRRILRETVNESMVVRRRLDDLSKHITSSYKWLDPKRFDNFDKYLERVIFNVVRDFSSELGIQDYEKILEVREEIKPFVTQYIIDNYLEDIKYYFGIFT
jgi:patatin-like phospholipase/acyl hydrolase